MTDRRVVAALLALVAGGAFPLACTSQTVDAVEIKRRLDAGRDTPDGSTLPDANPDVDAAADADAEPPDGGEAPDGDGDGVPDSEDECDDNAAKIVPGVCGCDLPEPPADGGPSCLNLLADLAHRYTFSGPSGSTAVVDSINGNDGELVNAMLAGDGTAVLAGAASDEYVNLPNALLSTLPAQAQAPVPSATLEAWVYWNGGADWQRIFEFGSNPGGEDRQWSSGTTYLFMTARTPPDEAARHYSGKLRVSYKGPGTDNREAFVEASIAMPSGVVVNRPTHVALVVDGLASTMSIYVNGTLQEGLAMYGGILGDGGVPYELVDPAGPYDWKRPLADGGLPPAVDLAGIDDTNSWLGRSQFTMDPELDATYVEFRIYRNALSPQLISISRDAGPDPVFLPKPLQAGK